MYGNTKRRLDLIRESHEIKWRERQFYIVNQLLEYPPGWDFDIYVSQKDFVTLDFVLKNPDFVEWDWYSLSCHQNITFEDILKNPYLPWDGTGISLNDSVNLETVLGHPEIEWSWDSLSSNLGISIHDIVKTPLLNWNWLNVSHREDLTLQIVLETPMIPWDLLGVAMVAKMTEEELGKHRELPLLIEHLASNDNLSLDYILQRAESEYGTDIPGMRDIFYTVCNSKNHPMEEIMRYSEKEYFDYHFLSKLESLTFEDVQKIGYNIDWDWKCLSWSDGVKFSDILSNLDLPWEWGRIIMNPNLRWKDIMDFNQDHPLLAVWNVSSYVQNEMTGEKKDYIDGLCREHMAAFRIQCYFRRAYYDPKYAICKRRLNREYDEAME